MSKPNRGPLIDVAKDGSFSRKESVWRNWISSEDGAEFPPEKDRYHLFVAAACPWAQRTLITLKLKGLEEVIPYTVVHPTWQRTRPDDEDDTHCGWMFADTEGSTRTLTNTMGLGGPFPAALPGCEPNPLFEAESIRDLYEHADDELGKYTVPILWDKKQETIVSNESSEIIQMLNRCFNEFAKNPDLDLEPEELQAEMASVDPWIYDTLNNGVYRCGFATSQQAYDTAISELTESFDRIEGILQKQRYIAGNQLTLSDIRLFPTLLRFDEVYQVYFKCNTRSVRYTPALINYCRDIYQMEGVAETFDLEQTKMHYYTSHPYMNKFSIIPRGTDFIKCLQAPHDRENAPQKKNKSGAAA